MSELVRRKAMGIFYAEIEEDEKKLVRAAREGRMTIITGLLSTNMLNINKYSSIDNYDDDDEEEEDSDEEEYYTATPLFEAAKNGRMDIVRLLLDRGAKPSIPRGHGNSPLHTAAKQGHIGIAQLLLNNGADPNLENDHGETPLYVAFQNDHDNVEHLLLEKGARPPKEYFEQKLLLAIEHGNTRDVGNQLLSGVNINFDQSEPLRAAVRIGHKDIVVLLLSNGADPNPGDDYEESPLTTALELEQKDLAQILLDAGAVPNEEDKVTMEEWGCFKF